MALEAFHPRRKSSSDPSANRTITLEKIIAPRDVFPLPLLSEGFFIILDFFPRVWSLGIAEWIVLAGPWWECGAATIPPPAGANLGKTGIQSEASMGMDLSSHWNILQGIFLGEFWNRRGESEGEDRH